jgi:hypothetical protein
MKLSSLDGTLTLASMKASPITYIVKVANVNDKILVKPLLRKFQGF